MSIPLVPARSTERRPDHDVGRLFAARGKHRMGVADDARRCIDRPSGFAPSQAGSVVRAHAIGARHFGLNQREVERERACARFDDDRRRTAAGAMQVELSASNVDQAALR